MPAFLFSPRANSFDIEETAMVMYIGGQRQNAVTVSTMELIFYFNWFDIIFFCVFLWFWIFFFWKTRFWQKSSYCFLLSHNNILLCFLTALTTKYIQISGVNFLFAKLQVNSYSQIKTFGVSKIYILFLKKLIDQFSKDALNWSKVTVKTIGMLAVLLKFIFIKESWKQYKGFHKNIKQQKLLLTLIIIIIHFY